MSDISVTVTYTPTLSVSVATPGPQGATGEGVPVGGTTAQVLAKASNTDYDTEWVAQSGGAGGVSDGDKGDITVSASGTVWTIDAGVVSTTELGGDITTAGKALLDDADAATQRTTLGLGTAATAASGDFAAASHAHAQADITNLTTDLANKQPLDGELTALAGLVSAADKVPYFTGSGTAALADLTAAGRALIDDADASAQRTTLGLGTLATQSGTFSGTSSGTNTGDVTLAGTPDYITIVGQTITRGAVDLAADVTGDLPLANLAQSSAASKLLGRGSASGAGDFEEITLGTGLSMSGATLNGTAAGIAETLLDAKGDLIVASAADTAARLAVGTDGYSLEALAAESSGLKWTPKSAYAQSPTSGQYLFVGASAATGTDSPSLNQLRGHALVVRRPFTADRIAVEVTTVGAAGAVVRLGIYATGTDGYPGALILDAGTVVADVGTGIKEITISQAIPAGLVWLVSVPQVATSTIRTFTSPVMTWAHPSTSTWTSANVSGLYLSSVSGALPDPLGTPTGISATAGVRMYLRGA